MSASGSHKAACVINPPLFTHVSSSCATASVVARVVRVPVNLWPPSGVALAALRREDANRREVLTRGRRPGMTKLKAFNQSEISFPARLRDG